MEDRRAPGRYREVYGDLRRFTEIWGDIGRYREIYGAKGVEDRRARVDVHDIVDRLLRHKG